MTEYNTKLTDISLKMSYRQAQKISIFAVGQRFKTSPPGYVEAYRVNSRGNIGDLVELLPDEARQMANALWAAADQAEAPGKEELWRLTLKRRNER